MGWHLEVLGEGARQASGLSSPSSLTSQAGLLAVHAKAGSQLAGAPQGGRQDFLCPDFLRVLLVTMSRLVAKLPVVVSAVALDVNATDSVP